MSSQLPNYSHTLIQIRQEKTSDDLQLFFSPSHFDLLSVSIVAGFLFLPNMSVCRHV